MKINWLRLTMCTVGALMFLAGLAVGLATAFHSYGYTPINSMMLFAATFAAAGAAVFLVGTEV